MILFALPQSPYCAKVRAVLAFKQIDYEEQEPAGGSYQTTEYQEVVAAGSIPAIQIDHWTLHDSQAIAEYLEEIVPQPSIWSADARMRAAQRALVHYHDSKLEPAVRALVPHARQPQSSERDQQIGVARDQLFDRLYRLEKMVHPSPWLGGENLCLADFCFPVTIHIGLDMLEHVGAELALPTKLASWFWRVEENEIIREEIMRTRGAIAQWLSGDNLKN